MDDWAAARALLAGDMEGGEPYDAAQHLPVLHHPFDPETAQLQGLEPPIRRSFSRLWESFRLYLASMALPVA